MANLNAPAVWVEIPETRHAHSPNGGLSLVCRDCGWRGFGPDRVGSESEREQGARHASQNRGHVVVLTEVTYSVCVAPDVAFVLRPSKY